MGLHAYAYGIRDPETLGLIRRWRHRYDEYVSIAPSLRLGVYPLPELSPPALGEREFNTSIPENLISGKALPVFIDFNTLNRCNASCTMCPPAVDHDDKGIPLDDYYRLSVKEFSNICNGLNVKGAHFVGAYAEPLLNKDIFSLIKMAHEAGAHTAITTNATLLGPAIANKILDAGLDMMTVSLHGATAETAQSIMRKTSFTRVIENLRYFQSLKAARGLIKPEIYFNFVAQATNIKEIPDFISLAADLGVFHVHIVHLIDGGLDDKTNNPIHQAELLGPSIVEAKRRASDKHINIYVSPAFSEIVSAYEAKM